jgi:hypothetical protein
MAAVRRRRWQYRMRVTLAFLRAVLIPPAIIGGALGLYWLALESIKGLVR